MSLTPKTFEFVVALTILYFDHALTFSDEVTLFWKTTSTVPVKLFLLLRYLSLFGNLPLLYFRLGPGSLERSTCIALQAYEQVFWSVVQLIVVVLLIFRVYALHCRNKKILSLFFVLVGIVAIVGLWSLVTSWKNVLFTSNVSLVITRGCVTPTAPQQAPKYALLWGCLLAFDTILAIATVWKAIELRRISRRSLVRLLLRDGIMYYTALSSLDIVNIVTYVVLPPSTKGILINVTITLSVAAVSRLMINLRKELLLEEDDLTAGLSTVSLS